MIKKLFLFMIAAVLTASQASALTREQIRESYAEIVSDAANDEMFDVLPDVSHLTYVGSLNEDKLRNVLDYVNLIRSIAGLNDVRMDDLYSARAQHAACLLAANDELTHTPERNNQMSESAYETAYAGASESNIARLEWYHSEILLESVSYFVRDDGEDNKLVLPHRRWLLDPSMEATGFGLAVSETGNSYIAMYAVDGANRDTDWDHVAWPAQGCFPAEMMRSDLSWSVMLNDAVYDPALSHPIVTLTELNSGESYLFDITAETGDGACAADQEPYGSGWCIAFVPDRKEDQSYEQNQCWEVYIEGLVKVGGEKTSISYETDMIALTKQDAVNIELNESNAQLNVGETLQLCASVIPEYADDLTVQLYSDDTDVASVGADGIVTAKAQGKCTIYAENADGAQDQCMITVNAVRSQEGE